MSADIAAYEIDKLRNEIARLKGQTNWVCKCGGTDCEGQKENADLRDTLDAVIWADERGVELWRAAHPGKELVIPDRAKLLEWLLEQNAALRELTSTLGAPNHINVPVEQWRELRADKERLDWLSTALGGYWACEHFEHRNRISRTYIDAGMADNPTPAELKKEQPCQS